jgi:hypothetical protein
VLTDSSASWTSFAFKSPMRALTLSPAEIATQAATVDPWRDAATAVYALMSPRIPAATAKLEASSVTVETRNPLDTRFCVTCMSDTVARRNFCARSAPAFVFTLVMRPSVMARDRHSAGHRPPDRSWVGAATAGAGPTVATR